MSTSIKRYPNKEHNQPTERICRTLDLRDNPELIAEYRRRHSREAIWPEVPAGIREVGILEMEIYLLDTRLFMIVDIPAGLDWDAAMEQLANLPRQQEWEDYMAIFQLVKPGSTAAEKWLPMERIFHLYEPDKE
ncbi:L-rhamnose mutarotase [Bacteroides sp. UBA939]|uniref:L-rhamnose mutarotase n=1 Tax=Bacteroides sp. UBA939 TaxID=1946092 RepID=UPI0025C1A7F1|nr:L-rhamnose mutarotase [Bacteroides sp. UBA939]